MNQKLDNEQKNHYAAPIQSNKNMNQKLENEKISYNAAPTPTSKK